MNNITVKKGKLLALVLRHKPEHLGLTLDEEGWVSVSELIKTGEFTKELLDEIIETNNKKRFAYNEKETKIRAVQGHSIEVNLKLPEVVPPDYLYHGTQTKFLDSIFEKGLIRGQRHHVHLSTDVETATDVGSRHGANTIVLRIMSKLMYEAGFKFFISENNVYLANNIPPRYLEIF